MKGYLYLILLVAPALALPAQGGIFTYKPNTARPKPETQVPALLYTVKADPNESKRAAAAAELREFDARLFPDMVPVLVDVLQNDTKPSVRREAAISLGHLPVTPLAGKALQDASSKDPCLRVRLHAWTAFKCYQLHGYHDHPVAPPPKVVATTEPPVAHQTVTYTPRTAAPALAPPQATPVSNLPANDGPVLIPQK